MSEQQLSQFRLPKNNSGVATSSSGRGGDSQ